MGDRAGTLRTLGGRPPGAAVRGEVLPAVAQQEARAGAARGGAVVAIAEGALVQREATAADAAVQAIAGSFEHLDLGAQDAADALADRLPVLPRRGPPLRQRDELGLDLGEAQPELLG